MIGIIVSLAFGFAAGLFAPLAAFCAGLLIAFGVLGFARYGDATLGSFLLEAVMLVFAAQAGYATAVFLRATLLKTKRDAAADPSRSGASAPEDLRRMSD